MNSNIFLGRSKVSLPLSHNIQSEINTQITNMKNKLSLFLMTIPFSWYMKKTSSVKSVYVCEVKATPILNSVFLRGLFILSLILKSKYSLTASLCWRVFNFLFVLMLILGAVRIQFSNFLGKVHPSLFITS